MIPRKCNQGPLFPRARLECPVNSDATRHKVSNKVPAMLRTCMSSAKIARNIIHLKLTHIPRTCSRTGPDTCCFAHKCRVANKCKVSGDVTDALLKHTEPKHTFDARQHRCTQFRGTCIDGFDLRISSSRLQTVTSMPITPRNFQRFGSVLSYTACDAVVTSIPEKIWGAVESGVEREQVTASWEHQCFSASTFAMTRLLSLVRRR